MLPILEHADPDCIKGQFMCKNVKNLPKTVDFIEKTVDL